MSVVTLANRALTPDQSVYPEAYSGLRYLVAPTLGNTGNEMINLAPNAVGTIHGVNLNSGNVWTTGKYGPAFYHNAVNGFCSLHRIWHNRDRYTGVRFRYRWEKNGIGNLAFIIGEIRISIRDSSLSISKTGSGLNQNGSYSYTSSKTDWNDCVMWCSWYINGDNFIMINGDEVGQFTQSGNWTTHSSYTSLDHIGNVQLGGGGGGAYSKWDLDFCGVWHGVKWDPHADWLCAPVEAMFERRYLPFTQKQPTSAISITVQSATHGHTADSPSITQTHVIAVDDADHGHTADAPAITQTHVIVAEDANHGHTADSPSVSQTHVIGVADGSHAHTADAPAITQTHVIGVVNAAHGHTAGNATVTIGSVSLTAQDAVHAHSADSPTVTQTHIITVASSNHGHAAGTPAITQTHVVSVEDGSHGHTADTATVTVGGVSVTPQDATHAHAADSPLLSQTHIIAVADAVHSHLADTPAITQTHVIVVQDALHGHLADVVTVTIGALFFPPGFETRVPRNRFHTRVQSRRFHTRVPAHGR